PAAARQAGGVRGLLREIADFDAKLRRSPRQLGKYSPRSWPPRGIGRQSSASHCAQARFGKGVQQPRIYAEKTRQVGGIAQKFQSRSCPGAAIRRYSMEPVLA